jgi:hypothetical protein
MLSGGQTPYPHIPDPLPSLVGTHHPPTYENGFFTPLNFLKQDKSTPEAILKNHSKSQKIIK